MTSLSISIPAPSRWPDVSVGSVAAHVRERVRSILVSERERSVALGSRRWALEAACSEAAEPNWDGYGAKAVDRDTFTLAQDFLDALPAASPDPDIAVDPDGEVSFRWAHAPREVLVVNLRGDGRASFAAILGEQEIHGTTRFMGEQIPEELANKMARLFTAWS